MNWTAEPSFAERKEAEGWVYSDPPLFVQGLFETRSVASVRFSGAEWERDLFARANGTSYWRYRFKEVA